MGATFNAVAAAPVSETTAHDRVSVEEDSLILTKGGVDELERQVRDLDENRPSVMTAAFGGGQYTLEPSTRGPGNRCNLTHFFHFLFYGCRRRSFED